jgi:hypothetical protein
MRAKSLAIFTLLALSACLLAANPAWAQESRGAIGGQVLDSAKALIPGAAVVIKNLETGQTIKLLTNESGAYAAPLLALGTYSIEVEAAGFKRAVRPGVQVGVSDRLQVDFQLEVGEIQQSVTVTEATPLLQSADASLGQLIDAQRLAELPLPHGNPYALISLATGTAFEGDPKLNRPFEPTHIVAYTMNGTRTGTSDVTIDGVANTAVTSRSGATNFNTVTASYVPPGDAVAEFKVQTAMFDAKMGQTPGGVINISLRSGTNQFHGSAYFNKRLPELMANDFFINSAGQERPDFKYNRWGGSFRGPVEIPKLYNGRDRTFFMWAYEEMKESRTRGSTFTVPTEAQRTGNFSELLGLGSNYQIYNPFTRRASSSTRYTADPFPNNVIPAPLLNPVSLKILENFPKPFNSGRTADHLDNFPAQNELEVIDYWTHVVKIDHNLSQRNRFFVRGNLYDRSSFINDWFRSYASGQAQNYLSRGGSLDDVHTFSPSFLGNFRYGYNRYVRLTSPKRGRGFDLTSLGFPASLNNAIDPALREFPVIIVRAGGTTILQSQNTGEDRNIDTHSFVAAFTKTKGAHTIEFGHEYRAYRYNRYVTTTSGSGSYLFEETYTRGPIDNSPASPMGQGFAALLLGIPSTSGSSMIVRNTSYATESTAWMFYFQDNWRVNRKATVTLGVRYELEGPMTERYNRTLRGFDPDVVQPQEAAARAAYAAAYATTPTAELTPEQFKVRGGLQYAGVNGQPRELWDRNTRNIMPRVGLAYRLNEKTVLRTGYGVFYNPLGVRRGDPLQDGYSETTTFVPTSNQLTFTTLSNPFPNGILEPVGNSLGILIDLGKAATFFNSHPASSYMQRWQLSIQRELPRQIFLEVAYVGNYGTNIETEVASTSSNSFTPIKDLNALPSKYLSTSVIRDAANSANNSYWTANLQFNPFRNLPNMGTFASNTTITRAALVRPYPQYTQLMTTDNNGTSFYQSLQVRAERRPRNGLTTSLGYTWSKFMERVMYLNAGDEMPSRSVAQQDHPHRITVSTVYELPVGRRKKFLSGMHGVANAIVGGWQVQGIYTWQTGSPITWPDAVLLTEGSNVALDTRDPNRWFNTSAFLTESTLLPQNHLRTFSRYFNTIRLANTNNFDLAVTKKWRVREGMTLQVRADFLNALNHTRFGSPNTQPTNRSFGQITATAADPRQVQLGMKLTF